MILFGTIAQTGIAQTAERWYAFQDQTQLYGYKDANDVVRIKPRFTTAPTNFDNIICVGQYLGNNNKEVVSFDTYFLTKSGRRIDHHLYISTRGVVDSECEGFIRYRHYNMWKLPQFTGLLDRNGDIAIEANRFNYLSRVQNGLLWAEEGAVCKTSADGRPTWENGSGIMLIDTTGQVLINADECMVDQYDMIYLKLHTCRISPSPHTDSTRVSFMGVNGEYYSFVDYRKEFLTWIKERAKDINETNVDSILGPQITLQLHNGGGPLYCQPENLEPKYKNSLIQAINAIAKGEAMHGISQAMSYFFVSDYWINEFAASGKGGNELPTFEIFKVVEPATSIREHYYFLDTKQGFKLSKIQMY